MTGQTSRTVPSRLLGLGLAALTLTVGCPAAGPQERPVSEEQRAVDELQQEVDLLHEINRLQLSKEQLAGLIGAVEAVQAKMRDQQRERDHVLSLLKPLLEAQKAALLRDEGVPAATAEQINQQLEALQEFDQQADEQLQAFAPQVRKILTEPQIDILTWVSEARVRARSLVDWAKSMTDEDFATDAAVNAENLAEGREDISTEQVLEIFQQAHAAHATPEAEWQKSASREKLVEQLIPATRDDATPVDRVLIQRLQPPRLPAVLREKLAQMG